MLKRIAGFAYGIFAFLVGAGANAYLAGFLGNVVVPKSIDGGPPDSVWIALLVNLALLGLFGAQHSGMAREGFKRWLRRYVPDRLERSTYVLFSGVVLGVLYWFWQPIPTVVWSVDNTVGRVLLWGLFGAGWILLAVASDAIDAFHLQGLRQAYAYLQDAEYSPPEFQTPGLYQYTRHPLMLGFLIVFWATPHMTVGQLLFALVMSIYVYVGVVFEERELIRRFGERYRQYQRRTPMLIPGLGRSLPAPNWSC